MTTEIKNACLRVVYRDRLRGELSPRDTDGKIVDAMPRTPSEGYTLAEAKDYARWIVRNTAWTNGTAHVQRAGQDGRFRTIHTYTD